MPRPRTHDEALRVRLLDRAGRLLSSEGAAALSLRRLAADVGTSTTAVYSLFGGKPALLRELYVEGFRRFNARLRAVEHTGDPAEDLVRIGIVYRQSALADPHLYSIMFTRVLPDFEPDADAIAESTAAFMPLVEVVREAIESGVFTQTAPDTVAITSWGLVHGLVSLELNGNLPPGMDVAGAYEDALRANVRGWLKT
ncbi:TetR family transcriptional regulator [Herbihabitans rhizosphaerae]|uniref:TetR family transcriptional regulator n=1 Tax=Herbihabitans rhizosphaerae TaxID=1872711 RepID=A0A4Q7KKR9_9PSEU|nr:TetR/AcrR family transcriptional regulator [Herbihabitans rhizosphaerae]RZS36817.1 TetR family transcriptional regulator [Herbihabitans rhizosphaerae]